MCNYKIDIIVKGGIGVEPVKPRGSRLHRICVHEHEKGEKFMSTNSVSI